MRTRFSAGVAAGLIAAGLGGLVGPTAGFARADTQALSPFDVTNAAVGNLDPALLAAVQQAAVAAGAEGVPMTITSGWRSPEFQQQLLDDAVATYGSSAPPPAGSCRPRNNPGM